MLRSLLVAGLISGFMLPSLVAVEAKAPHHVMWINMNGKAKCCNKGSKEKAMKCAAKLRAKAAADVKVMEGKCKPTP